MTAITAALYAIRIPLDQLQEGHAYLIKARNGHLGIYRNDPEPKKEWGHDGFDLPRNKYGSTFIDTEYDWDTGGGFGTAIPIKDLGPVPDFADNTAKLKWLIARSEATEAEYKTLFDNAWTAFQAREFSQ